MQKMVAVQTTEKPRAFHVAALGKVHAPMAVFVGAVVSQKGEAHHDRCPWPPQTGDPREEGSKQSRGNEDQNRAVPPCHRNRPLVLRMTIEMVCVVRLKMSVVYKRMTCKRIAKESEKWPVHKEPVQCPLEEGSGRDTQKYNVGNFRYHNFEGGAREVRY